MIERMYKSELLQELKLSTKILVVYGARQVGKTTLVRDVLKEYGKKTLEISADELAYHSVLSSRDFNQLSALVEGYEVLFIDEAQRVPDIGINLKIFHERLPKLRIIVTGSSSLDLASKVNEPLTGRIRTYELFPIGLKEWINYTEANSFETREQLTDFLTYGMYPEIRTMKNPKRRKRYLKELTNGYLYKDILALANIKYPELLHKLLQLLAYQIGQEVSIQELAQSLQVHRETVLNYIDLLRKSFVIFPLSGFSRNLRKEVTKMDKIYFYDLGVRNALIENFSDVKIRPDLGLMWENFLIMERVKQNAYQMETPDYYYWRVYSGAELDLVESKNGQLYGFEFKWGKKKKRVPEKWISTYENSHFKLINQDNFTEILTYQL